MTRVLAGLLLCGAVMSGQETVTTEVRPLRVPATVMAAALTHMVIPATPPGVAGTVVVAVKIDKEGKVVSALAIAGPQELEPAVAEAVKGYTYSPYLVDGNPVEVQTTVTVRVGAPVADRRVRISGGVAQGLLVKHPSPIYSEEAKRKHMTGTVILHAVIGKDGLVHELTVISGPSELQAAAYNAVRQWTYKPYLLNGEIVSVDTTVTCNFSMSSY